MAEIVRAPASDEKFYGLVTWAETPNRGPVPDEFQGYYDRITKRLEDDLQNNPRELSLDAWRAVEIIWKVKHPIIVP